MTNPSEGAPPSPVRVRIAGLEDAAAWDRFVDAMTEGTFFHRFAWSTLLERTFGLKAFYFLAERDGGIVGILPLAFQNSRLFGRSLMSLPFCVEAGPLAVDDAALAALDAEAILLQQRLRCDALEYRSRVSRHPQWQVKGDLYATFTRGLSQSDEENLKAIPRKQRAVVRKTLGGGLTSAVEQDLAPFFRVYSESVRNLGTPVFPRRWFAALQETFADACDVLVIRDAGVPVSAVMNFYFRDTVLPYYGGGTAAARGNGANDFLYWEVMRQAAARGYRRFDFGRSKAGTGAFAFKKNWGFEPRFLQYEYHLAPGKALPEKNPNNPRYAPAISLWKKLPLPVANMLGPLLVGGLG